MLFPAARFLFRFSLRSFLSLDRFSFLDSLAAFPLPPLPDPEGAVLTGLSSNLEFSTGMTDEPWEEEDKVAPLPTVLVLLSSLVSASAFSPVAAGTSLMLLSCLVSASTFSPVAAGTSLMLLSSLVSASAFSPVAAGTSLMLLSCLVSASAFSPVAAGTSLLLSPLFFPLLLSSPLSSLSVMSPCCSSSPSFSSAISTTSFVPFSPLPPSWSCRI